MLVVVADDKPDMLLFVQNWFKRKFATHKEMRILTTDDLDHLSRFIAKNRKSGETLLVFLDLNWHEDKEKALQWVKQIKKLKKTRHWPVLIYSESNQEDDVLGAHRSLANGYVHKGDDNQEEQFLAVVEHWKQKQLLPLA